MNQPPGIGKSSIVWSWCCSTAVDGKKKILWIHISRSGCDVVDFCNDKITSWRTKNSNLDELIEQSSSDIIVVDGMKSSFNHFMLFLRQDLSLFLQWDSLWDKKNI